MPRPKRKTDEERSAYKLAWARANRERLTALRADPEKRKAKSEYDKRRYQERRKETIARSAAWYAENRERSVAAATAWAKANPDRVRANRRAWKYRHPDVARRIPVSGSASPEQIAARVAFYGGVCAYCGGPFEHIDHVIPLARGGTGWPSNIRPACRYCNQSKHAKRLDEWRPLRAP